MIRLVRRLQGILFAWFILAYGCDYNPDFPPPGRGCPEAFGNFVQLKGADFDTVYNEILILPAGVAVQEPPQFYPDWQRCPTCNVETFDWALPLDMSANSTTYILKGNARTDTITFTYSFRMINRHDCGVQLVAQNLITESTYASHAYVYPDSLNDRRFDSLMGVWHLWVNM